MTHAVGMGPLPSFLEEAAGTRAVERVFRAQGLPLALIDNPACLVPLAALHGLFECAAREAGDRGFGLRVGLAMTPQSYGLWAAYAASGLTLRQGITRLATALPLHQTGTRFSLQGNGKATWWHYWNPRCGNGEAAQHSNHVLPAMISFVRIYLGPSWQPTRVGVDYPRMSGSNVLEDLLPTEWHFARPTVALAIADESLDAPRATPVGIGAAFTACDVFAEATLRDTATPLTELEALLVVGLMEGSTKIDSIARLAGTSVRSLQRELNRSGASYRELLDRARLKKATALLSETQISITDIALSLGYSDSANFSRAFRRITGQSPSALREAQRMAARAG